MFTKKEKTVWYFILIVAVVGLLVGSIRHGLFYTHIPKQSASEDFSKAASLTNGMVNNDNDEENTVFQSSEIININTANKAELMTLPKIGPVTAERILHYREDYGAFKLIDNLTRVKGIGPKTLERLKPRITITEED
ncbi:MAG: ComEA family DNA-binding protein [Candidatus Marinimicrobia bacterium]|nr:ComEA family DNA-binding protein [Candidatus Neomarinimicrobiota bacterium]